jgi:hypothetical protein
LAARSLATTFPNLVGPVVAYTPSSVVWCGIDFNAPGAPLRSSWSLPIYDRGLDGVAADDAADDAAIIPIERATGPVLLISGRDDRMWPAHRRSGPRVVSGRAR